MSYVLLTISCCEEGKLEATDSEIIRQPVRRELLKTWLRDLERKGCYDKNGKHWGWGDMLIFMQPPVPEEEYKM